MPLAPLTPPPIQCLLQDWLHIPNLYGQTEEELLAHSADPANCTDETFPAGGAALCGPRRPAPLLLTDQLSTVFSSLHAPLLIGSPLPHPPLPAQR